MLKLRIILLVLVCMNTVTNAQTTSRQLAIAKLKKAMLEEKFRLPRQIQQSELDEFDKQPTSNPKITRAADLKVSTNSSLNEEGEAQIIYNPQNPNQMAISYMEISASTGLIQYPVYISSDAGSTWQKSTLNTWSKVIQDYPGAQFAGGGDPILIFDKDNKLQFSWIYLFANNGNVDSVFAIMYHATSTDNGQTFTLQPGSAHMMSKSSFDINNPDFVVYSGSEGFHDRQWFAIDRTNGPNKNTLYNSFVYFGAPDEPVAATGSYIQKKLNGVDSFSKTKIQVAEGAIQFNNVAVDTKGNLHVTGANIETNEVIYCKSTDGGSTFSAPIVLYTGTNIFGHQDAGFVHDRENSAVNMVVDGDDNIHVVWTNFEMDTSFNFISYYARSVDGGTTFNTPQNLNLLYSPVGKPLMPVVSAFGKKVNIGASVVDVSKKSVYMVLRSDNNGASFYFKDTLSTAVTDFGKASNNGVWFGDYYNAVRTDTKEYHIWSDGRGANRSKMYVSVFNAWATGVNDIIPINSTVQVSSIFPNPAVNTIQVNIDATEANQINYSIFGTNGALILSNKKDVNIGENVLPINIGALASGIYNLHITTKDGFVISKHFAVK